MMPNRIFSAIEIAALRMGAQFIAQGEELGAGGVIEIDGDKQPHGAVSVLFGAGSESNVMK